jgi:hypothetical protein
MWYPFPVPTPGPEFKDYLLSVVSNISDDAKLRDFALLNRLTINRVTWEDPSRWKDSALGDNITDQTLTVSGQLCTLMPVIRRPNLSDITCDMDIDAFSVMVGNETGSLLTKISLQQYLQNIGTYTGNPELKSMYDPRDKAILTSSQFCILPLKDGKVNFGVQLFNYQSEEDNSALLTIVASKEGTSTQVITEKRQILYFNQNGRAHDFSATRLSDDRAARGVAKGGSMTSEEQERNCLIILHVPLVAKPIGRRVYMSSAKTSMAKSMAMAESASMLPAPTATRGLEEAMLSVGDDKGAFRGIKGERGQTLKLERDTTKPIRAVLQFYVLTDTDQIKEPAFEFMSDKIGQVCKSGRNTGSLVVSGPTGRPTETTVVNTRPMFTGFSKNGTTLEWS